MPGMTYDQYISVARATKQDARIPPDAQLCRNAIHLASWFKLFGYAARATREGAR